MKKILSLVLVLVMLLASFAVPASAIWPFDGANQEVQSVSVDVKKGLIENVDGDIFTEETKDIFYYDVYYAYAVYTVVYKNGETEVGEQYDLSGELYLYDNQEKEPWGLGKHTVNGEYKNFKFTFEVEVVENPVASITAVATKPLVEGWDCYQEMHYDDNDEKPPVPYDVYNVYAAEPYFTVTMKDGTVIKGTDEQLLEQTGYWTYTNDDQYKNPLKVGKNTVMFEYLNKPVKCEIEVVANPYKSVSLKGENELYLVFEGVDKKDSYETKVVYSYIYDWNEVTGDYYAEIQTDNDKCYDIVIYSDKDENGNATLNKNVSIAIGPIVTKPLETCNYFKITFASSDLLSGLVDYYYASGKVSGKQFDGYNADKQADINDLVAIAAMVDVNYDNYDTTEKCAVYKVSAKESEDSIKKLFGTTDVDVKNSSFYKPLTGTIKIEVPWTSVYYSDDEIFFKDGKWVDTAKILDFETDKMLGKITVIRNQDGTIYSIDCEMVEIQKGDVNCDGKVAASDARIILQYVAGLVEEYDVYVLSADMNGDEKITAVDARMILSAVAGLK